MGLWENIQKGFGSYFDKQAAQREHIEELDREIEIKKRQLFDEQYKKDALTVATASALKDSAQLSGLKKLRASNRARNLKNNKMVPGSPYSKLAEFTQKNIAKRDANLERTKLMRADAAKMKEERLQQRLTRRTTPTRQPWSSNRIPLRKT